MPKENEPIKAPESQAKKTIERELEEMRQRGEEMAADTGFVERLKKDAPHLGEMVAEEHERKEKIQNKKAEIESFMDSVMEGSTSMWLGYKVDVMENNDGTVTFEVMITYKFDSKRFSQMESYLLENGYHQKNAPIGEGWTEIYTKTFQMEDL